MTNLYLNGIPERHQDEYFEEKYFTAEEELTSDLDAENEEIIRKQQKARREAEFDISDETAEYYNNLVRGK